MIKLQNLCKKYDAEYAIKDINLNFSNREVVTIIGPSGSGKSTLLRCINYLEIPTSGSVIINDRKLTIRNKDKLCLKIGMVFQNVNLFPHMNVMNNLIYSPINVLNLPKSACHAKATELLNKFGLSQKLSSMPMDLSGGQKQRVAICRALMMNPEIMLFDEPTSALDPELIKDVIEIISKLKTEVSMIIVTHHVKFAANISDRVIFMDKGRILTDQDKESFFSKPKSHRARIFLENVGDLM